jgi:hypothetical protein
MVDDKTLPAEPFPQAGRHQGIVLDQQYAHPLGSPAAGRHGGDRPSFILGRRN